MRFYIIGLEDNGRQMLHPEAERLIREHVVFSGGKRHHELMKERLPAGYRWIDITVPLENVFVQYRYEEEIVVFASGDPLFYGFAHTVQKYLPEAELQVFPYFNSLQLLAHRLLLPYQNMHVVSLTGRPWHEFDRALIEGQGMIGVLTDREHTPAAIACRMLEYGYDNYSMAVGEKLGNAEERVERYSLQEAARTAYLQPNCVLLEQTEQRQRWFGIPEDEFYLLNGRVNMITKMPVRLLALSLLDLRQRRCFWDIGFCTGSVSVEAKLQFPHLQVIAFEQRVEGGELMRQNSRKFGTPGITTITGDFTTADLTAWPVPDAVFIGGHGGKLEEMLSCLSGYMQPGGIVVFNSVSSESRIQFENIAVRKGFRIVKSCRIAVDAHHPITVLQAVLPASTVGE